MANTVESTPLNIEVINLDDECELDAFHDAWIASGQARVLMDFIAAGPLRNISAV